MTAQIYTILYLAGGLILTGLYYVRKKSLENFHAGSLPEISSGDLSEIIRLLKTSYDRMLLLGLCMIMLSSLYFSGSSTGLKSFFIIMVFFLFFANIPPRHKLIKALIDTDVSMKRLRSAGLKP